MSAEAFRSMIGSLCLLTGLFFAILIPVTALLLGVPLELPWTLLCGLLGVAGGLVLRAEVLRLLDGQRRAQEADRLRFHTAINNITQGVCFFDGSRRLIVCNDRYADLYRLTPEQVKPGTTLEQVVGHRFAAGSFPAMSHEAYLRWREGIVISDEPSDTVVELIDGRTIAIHHEPMPDGGWVATHADITEQRRAQLEIERLARLDSLTGLANRRVFRQHLEQLLAGDDAAGASIAVLYIDLDRFKEVNDTLGHPVGDLLIRGVADRLTACLDGIHFAARVGGDEFAVVQAGLPQPDGALALSQRLVDALSKPFDLDGHRVTVGASIGIALAGAASPGVDDLQKAVDLALYDAKSEARGSFRLFRPELLARADARRGHEHDLRAQ